jgi:serine/threonine protein kinase
VPTTAGSAYKARDTRLDRTVAIKMLPGDFAADPERARRFEREARTISKLNHPHICALHDLGQYDSSSFLVMEYLEGESLAERLSKGALPLEDALRYATQIAEALAEAHQQGIIPRDLKPANVVLTKKGPSCSTSGSPSCARARSRKKRPRPPPRS